MEQANKDIIDSIFKKMGLAFKNERRVMLLCMALSFVVWFFVKMSNNYESRGALGLNYQLPTGPVFAEQPMTSMPFKFAGSGWKLLKMSLLRQKPSLSFNLSGASSQVITSSDISRKIEEELQLRLLELGQDNLAIRLDSLQSKKLRIELDTAISFENGYYFRDNIVLRPDSVMVFGAPQLLNLIDAIKTAPLKMECPEKDFSIVLDLLNPNPELLQMSVDKVEVFMPVEQYTEKKLMIPVMVLNERDSVRLLPGTVELECVVGISRYNDLSPADFRVVAVLDNENPTPIVPLTLVRQPSWVKSARFSPQAVEYLIVQ
ncbi:MAG: hypothetical protein IPN76_13120 [Saprospiraceae bacterium]|nr:hypothetical protein [Saprospiraceae bacterium]